MTRRRGPAEITIKPKRAKRTYNTTTPGRINGRKYQQLRAQFKEACRRSNRPCWLCHQPIDYNAKALQPNSFELDHIHPVSQRPDLQLVQAYWQPAHSRCNRSRSTKPAEQQGNWVRPTW